MRWTSRKPSAHGFYWCRWKSPLSPDTEIMQITEGYDGLYAAPCGYEPDRLSLFSDSLEWFGPLEAPEGE